MTEERRGKPGAVLEDEKELASRGFPTDEAVKQSHMRRPPAEGRRPIDQILVAHGLVLRNPGAVEGAPVTHKAHVIRRHRIDCVATPIDCTEVLNAGDQAVRIAHHGCIEPRSLLDGGLVVRVDQSHVETACTWHARRARAAPKLIQLRLQRQMSKGCVDQRKHAWRCERMNDDELRSGVETGSRLTKAATSPESSSLLGLAMAARSQQAEFLPAYTRVTLKHPPPPFLIGSKTPVLGVGFVTVPKDPPGGGSLGAWIRCAGQRPPQRGVPWILDSPGPPLTTSDSFQMT